MYIDYKHVIKPESKGSAPKWISLIFILAFLWGGLQLKLMLLFCVGIVHTYLSNCIS